MRLPTPKRAVLIRVGIDQTCGGWNAPCNPSTGDFLYVPIPESKPNQAGMERTYAAIITPALHAFAQRNPVGDLQLPTQLCNQRMHLDPDFDHLTYGDTERRGRVLLDLKPNDLVAFYSGMRALQNNTGLVYGLIGMLVVAAIRRVAEIPADEFACNAHTRRSDRQDADIIVTGAPGVSGRFRRYIDVGEYRNHSYRVRNDVLDEWGGLSVNDGYIHRSANPPKFCDPERFTRWLMSQAPELVAANNLST